MPESIRKIPDWVHMGILMVLLSITGALGYVVFRGNQLTGRSENATRLPEWKRTANRIVRDTIEEDRSKIPSFIDLLSHRNKSVRQNALWGLHYLTNLPWDQKPEKCRRWWIRKQKGKEPGPPPEGGAFSRGVSSETAGLRIQFSLQPSDKVVLKNQDEGISYKISIMNTKTRSPIQFYSPNILPYRAYRFTKGGRRIPVHNQYGPSVMRLRAEFVSVRSDKQDKVMERMNYFHPIGKRKLDSVEEGEGDTGIVMNHIFPVPRKIRSVVEEGAYIRFVLESQGLLAERRGEKFRVQFSPFQEKVEIQWNNEP